MEKRSSHYLNEKEIHLERSEIISFLRQEYYYLQTTIDAYDQKALYIKTWSVSFSLAVFATGALNGVLDLFLLGGSASVLFWILETYWKIYQKLFIKRAREVEIFLNGKAMEKFRLVDIVGTFDNEVKKEFSRKKWIETMFLAHIYLPHLVISLLGLMIWLTKFK